VEVRPFWDFGILVKIFTKEILLWIVYHSLIMSAGSYDDVTVLDS
jgi:hypothetical protein